MKKILILIIVSFIYNNHLNAFKITFPLPGMISNTCRIEGTAEPFETIRLFIRDQEIERVAADKNGKWSCCPKFPKNFFMKFTDAITVYNSKNEFVKQELYIDAETIQLTIINKTDIPIALFFNNFHQHVIDEVFHLDSDTPTKINTCYIDGNFYFENEIIDNLVIKSAKIKQSVPISQIMEPYLKRLELIKKYREDLKLMLTEYIKGMPISLIDIIKEYSLNEEYSFDESDRLFDFIISGYNFIEKDFNLSDKDFIFYIILKSSKFCLLNEEDYQKYLEDLVLSQI